MVLIMQHVVSEEDDLIEYLWGHSLPKVYFMFDTQHFVSLGRGERKARRALLKKTPREK